MGTWPDPNTGNKTIGVVGPLVDDGGVVSDLKALGLPINAYSPVQGKSYYFPFQVYEFWMPFYIAASITGSASALLPRSIQFAIYSEGGATSATQVATTTAWETHNQAATFNIHTLSPQPTLPPGGYYVGFQVIPIITDAGQATNVYGSPTYSRILGVRESASPFQSNVTDLTTMTSTIGILADLHVRAVFL